jgi:hypothetical protein
MAPPSLFRGTSTTPIEARGVGGPVYATDLDELRARGRALPGAAEALCAPR